MRSESESAEFEIKCTSPFTPSRKRQRILSLRPRPTESKVAGYFAPGGILDSQTTETQWMGQYSPQLNQPDNDKKSVDLDEGQGVSPPPSPPYGISQSDYLELQERQKKKNNSGASDTRPSSSTPTASPQEELVAKASLEIINITRNVVQEEIEVLKGACLNLEDEVKAVTVRRDLMGRDLGREREWIRLLELTLKNHAIPFPPYPFS